ncbi:unnamed protein product [Rhizoctonia solani]|uniref:Uncharacterized protein n=1 Tax=Rhizoctonia solani TaxID=456999 RepID=A0A8H3HQS9_9AGAM|nr:unnamed protein product [Rhizoctonia solani]
MFTLPTVSTKNEARANQNDTSGNKCSIADSLVLLQSLKQSRSVWLTKAFLRFSTRSKDKTNQVNPPPPPHSLSLAGSCDLEIGPHLFPQTKIFFVEYQYRQPPPPVATPTQAPPPAPTPAPVAQHPPPITVSHELHAKVLAAASKDPELNHILQLASRGGASVIQLRTLGTAIKSIEAGTYSGLASATSTSNIPSTPMATSSRVGQVQSTPTQAQPVSAAQSRAVTTPVSSTQVPTSTHKSAPTPILPPLSKSASLSTPHAIPAASSTSTHVLAQTPTPTRTMISPALPTTAVLLEFAERPTDRWLLPTEYVLIDQRSNGDIRLSTFYPFDAYVPAGSAMRSKPAHPITMRFLGASNEIWNALSRTCTTVASSNVQAILAEVITNVPPRTYLQYRIAPGALWEDIKTANPHAQSFFPPSKAPAPGSATTRQRRTDSNTGGSVHKKRKIDSGDGSINKPKAKGKEKEKEGGSTIPAAATHIPTNQPVAAPIDQPILSKNAPLAQVSASAIPSAAEPTSKEITSAPIPIPNASAPKTTATTASPLIETLNTTSSRKNATYSARVIQAPQTTTSDNPAGPLYPSQRAALSRTSSPSQPPSQQADQSASVDPPA